MNRQEASLFFRPRVVSCSPVPPNKAMQTGGRFAAAADRQAVGRTKQMIEPISVAAVFAAALVYSSGAVQATAAQRGDRSRVEKNHILIQLAQSPRSQYGKVPYEKQSKPQQIFSAVWGLESEVNSGGFAQWFENSAGEMAVDTASALRAIGADRAAAIVAKAVALFPGGAPPGDNDARQQLLRTASDEIRSSWEHLDQEFFKYPDDLTSLLYAWMKAHPKEFGSIQ